VIKCITVIHHAQCNILQLHITIMYVNLNLKIIFWCVYVCMCVCWRACALFFVVVLL